FDIFVSADTRYPQILVEKGATLDTAKIYANGILVLWSAQKNLLPDKAGEILSNEKVKHIAIANPDTAPYGKAALSWMKARGLYENNAQKIVIGESISQASQFIASGNAEVGFTAKSIVLSAPMKNTGCWVALDEYPPIEQAAVLLKHAKS